MAHKVTTTAHTSQDVKVGALAIKSYTQVVRTQKFLLSLKLGKEIRGEVTEKLTTNADVENMVALTMDSRQSWEASCFFKAQRTG